MDLNCRLRSAKLSLRNVSLQLVFSLAFLTLFLFFKHFDYYNKHFFDSGTFVVIYNTCRLFFALYILWYVYFIGYILLSKFTPKNSFKQLSFLERGIASFATGLGVWHVFMLTLGFFNLYYESIIALICLSITILSANHFKVFALGVIDIAKSSQPNSYRNFTRASYIIISALLFLLLIIKGFYPGGGGDYFTHYFYYNLSVIKNHGIAPNDVWYHYYYSKGTGLQFLGMILMDPEAPALVTFCYVLVATFAIVNLVSKISKMSLWPCFAGALYILYNLVAVTGDGVDFQKTHEITTAIAVISLWLVCQFELSPRKWARIAFIALSSLLIAGAIITQAITVVLTLYLATLCGISLLTKNLKKFFFYLFSCVIATISVISIFMMNYLVTGLYTDQAIDFTWRHANLHTLDLWGIIPNIIMVMWVRHNYELMSPPWEYQTTLDQFIHFARIDVLWTLMLVSAISLIAFLLYLSYQNQLMKKELRHQISKEKIDTRAFDKYMTSIVSHSAIKITSLLALAFLIFSLASIFLGHAQEVSYFRFSSFIFPCLILTLTSIMALTTKHLKSKYNSALPILALIVTVSIWPNWPTRVLRAAHNAKRFTIGKYSLSTAYKHLQSGQPFGGVNPDAYAAFKHTPTKSRIWAMNVDSYCMAPGCIIESVFSFKLSSNLHRILLAKPKEAKAILQQEGLNYFLVLKNAKMIDILPYSQLFNPNNIGKHLGIKWTNGNAYLLTWSENADTKIDKSFLKMYKKLLKEAEHPWFRFKELIPELKETMASIKNAGQQIQPVEMSWVRKESAKISGIKIHHASYGKNCRISKDFPFIHLVSASNATEAVKSHCNGKNSCQFKITNSTFEGKVNVCSGNFDVSYYCRPTHPLKTITIEKPALGKVVNISCV